MRRRSTTSWPGASRARLLAGTTPAVRAAAPRLRLTTANAPARSVALQANTDRTMSADPATPARALNCAGRVFDLSRPRVMGILNVTPDSFSDGGALLDGDRPAMDRVLFKAEAMVADGVDMFDVGGESTRPGAPAVSAA